MIITVIIYKILTNKLFNKEQNANGPKTNVAKYMAKVLLVKQLIVY